MSPDRGHLHHRLIDMGFSQKQTVTILYTLTSILCLTAVVMSLKDVLRAVILVAAVVLIIFTSYLMSENKNKESENTENENNQ